MRQAKKVSLIVDVVMKNFNFQNLISKTEENNKYILCVQRDFNKNKSADYPIKKALKLTQKETDKEKVVKVVMKNFN